MADTVTKMATDGGGGAVDGRHSDNCKRNIGPWLKSPPGYVFLCLFSCFYYFSNLYIQKT